MKIQEFFTVWSYHIFATITESACQYEDFLAVNRTTVKPGLHIVVTIAEHACDDASKMILKFSMYRLQIFLEKNQYL